MLGRWSDPLPDCATIPMDSWSSPTKVECPRMYFSSMLGSLSVLFYKRRDYKLWWSAESIVAHEFLGSDITGKDA
jgi:hypothetical protein